MKSFQVSAFVIATAIGAFMFVDSPSRAAVIYKDVATTDMNPPANWSTVSGASTPDPASIGTSDTLRFNEYFAPAASNVAASLSANLAVGAIRLDSGSGGGGAATGNVTINAGNTLTLNGNNDYTGGLAQGIVLNSGAGGTLTVNPDIALGASQRWVTSRNLNVGGNVALGTNTLTLWTAGGTATISGEISGNGGIIRDTSSGGVAVLSGTNLYTGATTLNVGGIAIGNDGVSNSSALTLNGSSIIYLGVNGTTTVNNLSGAAGAAIRTDYTITGGSGSRDLKVNQTVNGTYAGTFVEGGSRPISLTKDGGAILTLSGAANYNGATKVDGGVLRVSNVMRNSASFDVGSGATLEFGATNIFTTGHGSAMADSRVITVDGGTLLFNTSMDSRFGNVTLQNGATWTSNRGLGAFDALLANTSAGAATVTVTNTGGNTTASTMNGSGGIHLQGVQNFNIADVTGNANADLTVSMNLGDPGNAGGAAGGINKTGLGTMQITGISTYSGNTTIGQGILQVTGGGSKLYNAAYNNTAVVQVNAGGTLKLDSFQYDQPGSLGKLADYRQRRVLNGGTIEVIGGTHTSGNDFTVNAAGGTFYYNPTVTTDTLTLAGNANTNIQLDGTLTFNAGGNITVNEVLEGSGGLIKTGAGTLRLTGTNTYSGGTSITGGTLTVGTGGAITQTFGVAMNNGAALIVENGANLTSTGNVQLNNINTSISVAGTMTAPSITAPWATSIDVDGSLSGGVVKFTTGSGVPITGAGTFSATSFEVGNFATINFGMTGSLNDSGFFGLGISGKNGNFTQSSGTVNLTTATAGQIRLATGNTTSVYTISDGTLNALNTPTIVAWGGSANGELKVTGGTANVEGLDMAASLNGQGKVTLTGGRLNVGSAGITTSGNGTSTINLGAGTVGALADWSSSLDMSLTDAGTGTTFNTLDAADGTTARNINLAGVLSGNGSLNKSGIGTLTLSGNNTYSGFTNVNAGELIVNGATTGQGDYNVASGARLGGDGFIGANVSVASTPGELSPGDAGYLPAGTPPTGSSAFSNSYSAGTDINTVGSLGVGGNVDLGGILLLDLMTAGQDMLNVGGEFTILNGPPNNAELEINGTTNLTEVDFWNILGWTQAGPSIDLVTFNSFGSGEFNNVNFNEHFADAGGHQVTVGLDGDSIFLAAVPEPASIAIWTLIGLIAVGISWYRCRRER